MQWGNVIGVLVTAILLSFGAPFWFERLKNVVKFKDALSKGLKMEDGGKDNRLLTKPARIRHLSPATVSARRSMRAIEKQLTEHEGLGETVYERPAGKRSVGVDRNPEG